MDQLLNRSLEVTHKPTNMAIFWGSNTENALAVGTWPQPHRGNFKRSSSGFRGGEQKKEGKGDEREDKGREDPIKFANSLCIYRVAQKSKPLGYQMIKKSY